MNNLGQLNRSHSARSSFLSESPSRAGGRRGFQDDSFEANQRSSRGSLLNSSYTNNGHSSPYLQGKKNASFVHPNLTSSNVFYDYDYAYKNEVPDPKQFSTIKIDRSKAQNASFSARSSINDPVADQRRAPYINSGRDRSYDMERSRTEKDLRAFGKSGQGQEDEVRQTVTKTAHGKFCAHCVNQHHREKKSENKEVNKAKDKEVMVEWTEAEERKGASNYDRERAERVLSAKQAREANNQKALYEHKQMYEKQRPADQGGMVIDAIFDKQEERAGQVRAMRENLKAHNLEQMRRGQGRGQDEHRPEFNSLQVGEGYTNKLLPHPDNVKAHVDKQIDQNYSKKLGNKEAERRIEQEILEANARVLEKERQNKKEKAENYKRMIKEQLANKTQDREVAKEKEKVQNEKNKYYAAQAVDELRAQEKNSVLTEKVKKIEFKQSLQEHQELAGYKRKHEQKKKYYEGNGVSLNVGEKKKLDTCTGCEKPSEMKHLSHKH